MRFIVTFFDINNFEDGSKSIPPWFAMSIETYKNDGVDDNWPCKIEITYGATLHEVVQNHDHIDVVADMTGIIINIDYHKLHDKRERNVATMIYDAIHSGRIPNLYGSATYVPYKNIKVLTYKRH